MNKVSKKYFLFFVLTLFLIILFFSSAFILPVLYTYTRNITKLIVLLALSSLASGVAIALILTYLSPTISEGISLIKRYSRLENLNHPLLVRLSTEAPGSYHHSISVANLGQKAAKALGADSTLARIAGYYHDIGKLIHPEIYIENQSQAKEKFKSLGQVYKVAKIITSHTKKGVEIAQHYRLPEEISNIIAEHHGSTLARFLYEEAKEFGIPEKNNFRYSGPKPQTIESAIIMLADCVEAATKGAKILDRARISEIVDKIIEDKIAEKQFHNLRISETELQKIRTSFIDTLSLMYHQRIYIADNDQN